MTTTSTNVQAMPIKLKGFANKETFGPSYGCFKADGFECHSVELHNGSILMVTEIARTGALQATIYGTDTGAGVIVGNQNTSEGWSVGLMLFTHFCSE